MPYESRLADVQLPAIQCGDRVAEFIASHQITILVGEAGSGKTTQVPRILLQSSTLEPDRYHPPLLPRSSRIVVTQPRRIAAITVAARVAAEIGEAPGQTVGHAVRFDSNVSPATKIKYATDGLLLREAISDPLLSSYSVVIVDEAHERSVQTDVLLGLLKRLTARRRDLRVVVMSATLDAGAFRSFFGATSIPFSPTPSLSDPIHQSLKPTPAKRATHKGAPPPPSASSDPVLPPVAAIPGRRYPVAVYQTAEAPSSVVDAAVVTALQLHLEAPPGDILVFLPGSDEITSAVAATADTLRVMVKASTVTVGGRDVSLKGRGLLPLPLYAALSPARQAAVFGEADWESYEALIADDSGRDAWLESVYERAAASLGKEKAMEKPDGSGGGGEAGGEAAREVVHGKGKKGARSRAQPPATLRDSISFEDAAAAAGVGGVSGGIRWRSESELAARASKAAKKRKRNGDSEEDVEALSSSACGAPTETACGKGDGSCGGAVVGVSGPALRTVRKVIFSTNVAETSVTVPGVRYVVDSGVAKVKMFHPATAIATLTVQPISAASALQRAGRAGREAAGRVYRLYTASEAACMVPSSVPEILRTDLMSVVLFMIAARVENVATFPFVAAPPPAGVASAYVSLHALGLIDGRGALTPLGVATVRIPLAPPLALACIAGAAVGVGDAVSVIAAAADSSHPLFTPPAAAQQAVDAALALHASSSGDHVTLLNVIRAYAKARGAARGALCKSLWMSSRGVDSVLRTAKDVAAVVKEVLNAEVRAAVGVVGAVVGEGAEVVRISASLAFGLRLQVGMAIKGGGYQLLPPPLHGILKSERERAQGRGGFGTIHGVGAVKSNQESKDVDAKDLAYLHPSSTLFCGRPPKVVVYSEVLETTKRWLRACTQVDAAWLHRFDPKLFTVSH